MIIVFKPGPGAAPHKPKRNTYLASEGVFVFSAVGYIRAVFVKTGKVKGSAGRFAQYCEAMKAFASLKVSNDEPRRGPTFSV